MTTPAGAAARAASGGARSRAGMSARGRSAIPLGQPPRGPRPLTPQQQRQRQRAQARRKVGRAARAERNVRVPGARSYQPAILAEFLIAVLVVALVPIAKPKEGKGLSPYSAGDMSRFMAIGAVYFILALMSSSPRMGRFAAWFGGLVLLGIGFVETDQGNIKPLFGIFTGGYAQSKESTAGSQPSGPPISAA